MRNVFDQYSQPENRLTHALAVALFEDTRLLKVFVRKVAGKDFPVGRLKIVEQRLPGQLEPSEADAHGLPDICIHDDDQWCLIVECKVAAGLHNSQLVRHVRTLAGRGFRKIQVLVVDVVAPRVRLVEDANFLSWSSLYEWLVKESGRSPWARHAMKYMEIVEARWSDEGYLKEGTLTAFAGIPFNADEPYSYQEARRLIKLAMSELRKNRRLIREIGMDPAQPGRGAITGKQSVAVWDYLNFKKSANNKKKAFTAYPHLTLAIESDRVLALVTVPHGITPRFRNNLTGLGDKGFSELLTEVNKRLIRELRGATEAAPWVVVVQRRYPSQRAQAFIDARIEYDLRTAFPGSSSKSGSVKMQPQWLNATFNALGNKRSNLQFSIGASFPYRNCKATGRREILDHIAGSWVACKPLLDVMFKSQR